MTSRTTKTTRSLAVVGGTAIALYGARFLLNFFGPNTAYRFDRSLNVPLDSEEFIQFLTLVTDGTLRRSRITRLKNGTEFYPAELAAIRRAQHAINLEFYKFGQDQIGTEFLAALCERARAGVQVRVIVDRIGSFSTHDSFFDPLRAAGGHMHWYHPLRWNTWQNADQRTHRKLIVIDGQTGFVASAGIADHWLHATPKGPAWRDTVFLVEGEAAAGLLSTFSENWLEASGEILSGAAQFNFRTVPEGVKSFVVSSTPHGGGTSARILFQSLISSAQKSIRITSPYFLPDRSARAALVAAVHRGVEVKILTAGPRIDHPVVRRLSMQSSRHLIKAGAHIYDYQPSMIHAKLMTIDNLWSVVGSTNFDHRSFGLNDEVNLAALDPDLAALINADQDADLQQSKPLTLAEVHRRMLVGDLPNILLHAMKWPS
ncbi:MAG: cardiolipin synthase B [Acidobacteria bacterium]|nr:cardiolipin synthase B [Acidobacteriota bacterium]